MINEKKFEITYCITFRMISKLQSPLVDYSKFSLLTFSTILTSVGSSVCVNSFMFAHEITSLKVFGAIGTLKWTFSSVSYSGM